MPSLSVITPCFNAALFIGGCIENVIEQGSDCEHIILDAGSTDGTVKIIERWAKRHPHIRWVSEPDKGQSDAMNKGIRMAQSDVLGFLNADDYYERGVLNRVETIFKDVTSPAFVVGNCNIYNHTGKLIRVSRPDGVTAVKILSGEMEHPVNPAAYFYHKVLHDICGEYVTEEHHMMDVDMLLKILHHANVYYFNEHWGNWRVHKQTKSYLMTLSGNSTDAFAEMMNRHIALLPAEEQARVKRLRAQMVPL